MAAAHHLSSSVLPMVAAVVFVFLVPRLRGARAATFTITNNCGYTVWPGLLSSAGSAPLSTTGFALAPGASQAVPAPSGWSGRMWGRTLCAASSADGAGKFACATGDCGSGDVQCNGGGAAPPATLAEFTLDGSGGLDFFDVSLVDGYNLPMLVTPLGASASSSAPSSGKCAATGCVAELNGACPADLRVASTTSASPVACRSACEAFGSAEYCCSGAYGNPNTCRPSAYSQFFKSACPRAYSYAYDDSTSTFTCAAGATDYSITFCPAAPTSVKSSGQNPQAAGLQQLNDTMIYFGGGGGGPNSSGATTASSRSPMAAAAAALVAVAVAALL
ncbi:thaumatin-like protein 1b [Oryza brachyantha]|uniref:thaumatin-like protein 1b n=1 Tax=Oryza brachyantha TaxID=4533 RepID=UPI001ADD0726|nr:thaumatin-like protein 1b [Oryza brachyantha]